MKEESQIQSNAIASSRTLSHQVLAKKNQAPPLPLMPVAPISSAPHASGTSRRQPVLFSTVIVGIGAVKTTVTLVQFTRSSMPVRVM